MIVDENYLETIQQWVNYISLTKVQANKLLRHTTIISRRTIFSYKSGVTLIPKYE